MTMDAAALPPGPGNWLSTSLELEAQLGVPPLMPLLGKVPTLTNWPRLVHEDPDRVRTAVASWHGNAGMVTGHLRRGPYAGHWLLGLDGDLERHPEAEDGLQTLYGLGLPRLTPTALTGGGGVHLLYIVAERIGTGTLAMFPGLDLRGEGGQLVAVRSVHPETNRAYEWEWSYSPADLPPALITAEPVLAILRQVGHGNNVSRELGPADQEAVNILIALGGHNPQLRDGYVEVTRPGKERGASATVGKLDPGTAYVWTSNWPGLAPGVWPLRKLQALVGAPTAGDRLLERWSLRAPLETGLPVLPPLRVRAASTIQPRPVEWLWPARIPLGAVTFLEGDPDLGKSTLALDIAARVSRGGMFPDQCAAPRGQVLILTAEDDVDTTVVPRLMAAGAVLENVHFVDGRPYYRDGQEELDLISLPLHLIQLEQTIRDMGVVLVILDALASYTGIRSADLYKDAVVRSELMFPLKAIAERTRCSFLPLRHLPKSMGRNAKVAGGGSIALGAAARSILLCAEHPEDETKRVLAVSKANLAARPDALAYELVDAGELPNGARAARVEWLGAVRMTSDQLLSAAQERQDAEDRSALQEAMDYLEGYLEGGKRPSADVEAVAKLGGISPATLKRARRRLGVRAFQTWDAAEGSSVWWMEWPPGVADPEDQPPYEPLGHDPLGFPRSEPYGSASRGSGVHVPKMSPWVQTVETRPGYLTAESETTDPKSGPEQTGKRREP